MADTVLLNFAGKILDSLASLLVAEEFRMVHGVKREIEKLGNTASAIQAVLHAEELRATNTAVDHWLERLNDVLYDADELLDAASTEGRRREIMTRGKKAKKVRIFFSKSNQLAFHRKMGRKIKVIREELDAIEADMKRFQFVERHVETPIRAIGRDSTYSFVLEQHVIGRMNDKEEVIRSLLDTIVEGDVSILPIVGMGGLGKTTLAQLVFNDERIQRNFDVKMWVNVSNNFNVKIIVEKIIEAASKKKPKRAEMNTLVDCLREEIVKKDFFLVLDDVWNEEREKWFELKRLLTNDVTGSKILVTTRSNEVARITHTIQPYILKGLEEEESWDLFKKMAFNGKEPENLNIMKIGKEIVRKCGGVPLALEAMGHMLSGKDSVEEWVAFRDNQISKISNTAILSTLKLSYDILPSHLKHCFVYCSLFPKDYIFNKSMLIKLWIAQGFVKSQQNRCLEDIGHSYFMELVSSLFFQKEVVSPYSFEEDNNVFKMHDLMHDLAISMAGSLIITKLENKGEDVIQKARHISFCGLNNISSLLKVSRTHTFIYFRGEEGNELMDLKKVISSFKLLRVLILGNDCVNMNYIGKLKHLRYLDLSGHGISKLPNSITRLINLETLVLSRCEYLQELPRDISKLVNLRHLDNSNCMRCRIPHGISCLTNLQTLKSFLVTSDSPSKHDVGFEELSGFKNLRGKLKLYDWRNGIRGTACESRMVMDPEAKSVFNVLELKGLIDTFPLDNYPEDSNMIQHFWTVIKQRININLLSSRPLSYLSTLTSLVELTVNSIQRCKSLPPLCQLPSLEKVLLRGLYDLEYILGYGEKDPLSSSMVSKTCFPSLMSLEIVECPNLKGWLWSNSPVKAKSNNGGDDSVMEHSLIPKFSCLSELSIRRCPMLTSMPTFPNTIVDLSLNGVSLKPLQETMMLSTSAGITSYSLATSLITPLSKLRKLNLFLVTDMEILSMNGLQYLTSLEILELWYLDKLQSLCLRKLQPFTALRKICISNCPELVFVNDEEEVQWQGLNCLLSVYFKQLPKLVSLPLWLQHATTLQELYIENCESLTTIPKWMCSYRSLKVLEIVKCINLTSILEGVVRLTSLEKLEIRYCPITFLSYEGKTELKLTNDEDGVKWQGLENLHDIRFEGLPRLVSLPWWLQHAHTLQKLHIAYCENLTTIPTWICHYKSLEVLKIVECSNLMSVPEELHRLTSLEML